MPVTIQPIAKRIVAVLTTLPPAWSVFIATVHTLSVEGLVNAIINGPEGRTPGVLHILVSSSRTEGLVFLVSIAAAVLIWGLSCYVYHVAALFFGGDNRYSRLLQTSAYALALPALLNLATVLVLHLIPQAASRRGWLECLTGVGYFGYFTVLLIMLKYLYGLRWRPAFSAILGPSGVLLLLTFYCIRHL